MKIVIDYCLEITIFLYGLQVFYFDYFKEFLATIILLFVFDNVIYVSLYYEFYY